MKPVDIQQWVDQYVRSLAPIFYLKLNSTGGIEETNEFTEKLVGKTLKGLNFSDVVVDFQDTLNLKELSENPLQNQMLNVDTFSGLPETIYATITAFEKNYVVLGYIDIEELENLRKEVLELNNDMISMNRILQKKTHELERLNSMKNKFLGYAAHDLRKPLSIILSYTEFLEDEAHEALSAEQQTFLKKISASADYMKTLINNFLDVSMIESGTFKLNCQKVNLKALLDTAFWQLELQAGKKDINITTRLDEHLPELNLDASKCEQVFLNIIGNAIEHSYPQSKVDIRVIKYKHSVDVLVRDFGVGISEEDQKKLFQPNQRIRTTKTGGEKSTGVGLMISKKIMEAHGGSIEVSSSLGKGSCFKLMFPVNPN